MTTQFVQQFEFVILKITRKVLVNFSSILEGNLIIVFSRDPTMSSDADMLKAKKMASPVAICLRNAYSITIRRFKIKVF